MKLNKKILLTILLSILLILLCNNVFATETYKDFEYEVNNNEVTITMFQGFKTSEDAGKGEVQVPDSINGYPVIKIGEFAFADMGIKKITLSNTLKTIESSAFSDNSFTSIDIPASVTKIADSVFPRCNSLKSINVNANNKNYCSINGVLYTKNKDTLVTYPIGKEDKSYVIENGVKTIEKRAFQDSKLEDITIPNTVTSIDYGAFARNNSLKKLTIPSSVKSIEDDVFYLITDNITLYVEKDSYAEKYAQNNKIKYEIIGAKENEKVNLSNNSIKIDTTTNVIPQNTKLLVEEVSSGNNYNIVTKAVEQDVNKFILYDISLESNNVKIQPNGKVKVSILLPTNYDRTNITVYRVENAGNKVEYTTKIENIDNQDYVVFETDHFSNYVVAEKKTVNEKKEEPKKEETSEHKLDNEPKTGIISITSILAVIITLSVVGIVISKNKMYK